MMMNGINSQKWRVNWPHGESFNPIRYKGFGPYIHIFSRSDFMVRKILTIMIVEVKISHFQYCLCNFDSNCLNRPNNLFYIRFENLGPFRIGLRWIFSRKFNCIRFPPNTKNLDPHSPLDTKTETKNGVERNSSSSTFGKVFKKVLEPQKVNNSLS